LSRARCGGGVDAEFSDAEGDPDFRGSAGMSMRQLAQWFAGVDAGFRRAERHVGEELDESVTGIRHLDPDSAMRLFP
jgi:hypothetical protein